MTRTALFIQHRTLPGKRDEMRQIWERHVKPRVEANSAHLFYFSVRTTWIPMSCASFSFTKAMKR